MHEFLAWLTGLVALIIPGFGAGGAPQFPGYVEAKYVYVAPAAGGTIQTIPVKEGDAVEKGAVLFTLKADQQQAAVSGADARVVAAQANLDNLLTGSREDEINVVRATLQKAQSDLNLARDSATRSEKLLTQGLIPQSQLDQDRASLASAEAAVRQYEAQLKVAELPARDAQQRQAEADLDAAKADASKARSDLSDRTVGAPVAGRVEQLIFDAGEMAIAGTPVVSLLPEGALKVKFYVPQAERPLLALGDQMAVSCDGCAPDIRATVSFFASDPQFTPPVIYSREERQRLTFLVEATLPDNAGVQPGQPVTLERVK